MKKFIVLAGMTATVALAWAQASVACWFRCGHRPPPSYCAGPYYPAPAYQMFPPVVVYPPAPVAVQPSLMPDRIVTSPKGRQYRMIDTGEAGLFVEKRQVGGPGGATRIDDFNGHDRKAAKISIADAPTETFANVAGLIATLPSDATMKALDISMDADSDRVEKEKRNVSVRGFIYAVKFEDDHDYHVILGLSPDAAQKVFLNVEVSGLPLGGSHRARLKDARTAFKDFFKEHGDHFGSSYKKFHPPIPVRIEGSLFFDVDHPAGVVGPTGMRPKTAWEIHPVTKIEFEIEP
jgi:hypothetical protein